jgi:hypothetical protein
MVFTIKIDIGLKDNEEYLRMATRSRIRAARSSSGEMVSGTIAAQRIPQTVLATTQFQATRSRDYVHLDANATPHAASLAPLHDIVLNADMRGVTDLHSDTGHREIPLADSGDHSEIVVPDTPKEVPAPVHVGELGDHEKPVVKTDEMGVHLERSRESSGEPM